MKSTSVHGYGTFSLNHYVVLKSVPVSSQWQNLPMGSPTTRKRRRMEMLNLLPNGLNMNQPTEWPRRSHMTDCPLEIKSELNQRKK